MSWFLAEESRKTQSLPPHDNRLLKHQRADVKKKEKRVRTVVQVHAIASTQEVHRGNSIVQYEEGVQIRRIPVLYPNVLYFRNGSARQVFGFSCNLKR